jgi:hypothetical protein
MRVYIICNDGITLCRTAPATINDGEIAVASNEELRAAPLSAKRLLALWNALPGVEKRKKVGDRDALIDQLWSAIDALPDQVRKLLNRAARMAAALGGSSGIRVGRTAREIDLSTGKAPESGTGHRPASEDNVDKGGNRHEEAHRRGDRVAGRHRFGDQGRCPRPRGGRYFQTNIIHRDAEWTLPGTFS